MSDPRLEFIHAPECGWKLTAYGHEVIIWEDGSLSYHKEGEQ